MADPVQLHLQDHALHGITGCSTADPYICHFVPPVEAENPLQTANVEGFEVFNVATVHVQHRIILASAAFGRLCQRAFQP